MDIQGGTITNLSEGKLRTQEKIFFPSIESFGCLPAWNFWLKCFSKHANKVTTTACPKIGLE